VRKTQGMPKKKAITDDYLLKLAGNICKERAGFRCEYPDCDAHYSRVHAHHVFHRAHASLRYDLSNCLVLCPYHHTLGSFSAHKDPTFIQRIISTGVRSPGWLDALTLRRNLIVKNNQAFKEEAYENLKKWGAE